MPSWYKKKSPFGYWDYVRNDILSTRDLLDSITYETKESKFSMKLEDIKVVVNGKHYQARDVNWIQTPSDFPRIEVGAYVSPHAVCASKNTYKPISITNVIFNPPATIVFWSDKTKTVVKCDYEVEAYDPEKGLAMAISKKLMGENKYEYYNVFRHWMKKWEKQQKQEMIIDDVRYRYFDELIEKFGV